MNQHRILFSKLNNGQFRVEGFIRLKYNAFTLKILQILQQHGFISHWCLETRALSEKKYASLLVYYKRDGLNEGSSVVIPFRIEGVSTKKSPSYVKTRDLWRLDKGLSLYILSTSRGVITDREARKWCVGGKIVCLVKS